MPNVNSEQLNKLPTDIREVLESSQGAEFVDMIVDKFKLENDQIFFLAELIRKVYVKQIKPSDLPAVISKLFQFDERLARAMAADVAGTRLLVVSGWFDENIAHLIEDWGGDSNKYAAHVEAQKKALAVEREYLAEQLADPLANDKVEEIINATDNLSIDDLLNICRDILKEQVVAYLKLDDIGVLHEINGEIIKVLSEKGQEARSQLSGILFANEEKISSQQIVLDGKLVSSTIGHWLEYFVRQKGGGVVDAVAIGDFVANSDNAKNLLSDERELLLRVLTLYKNLKFFPDSQNSSNPENWQIFPLVGESEEVEADDFIVERDEAFVPTQTAIPEINKQTVNEALRLQAMLQEYPEGSLERLAIEEELKKYN